MKFDLIWRGIPSRESLPGKPIHEIHEALHLFSCDSCDFVDRSYGIKKENTKPIGTLRPEARVDLKVR